MTSFPPGLSEAIQKGLLKAASTQCCEFISEIRPSTNEGYFEIEAIIGPADVPLGSSPPKYKVRFLIPKSFPYDVIETVPLDPALKWNQHQFADGDYSRANIICPPSLNNIPAEALFFPYIEHAYRWITDCLSGTLIKPLEDYEFPHLGEEPRGNFNFYIDIDNFPHSWISKNKFGMAWTTEINGSKSGKLYRVRELEAINPLEGPKNIESSIRDNCFVNGETKGWIPWIFGGNPVFKVPHQRFQKLSEFSLEFRDEFLNACKNVMEKQFTLPYLLLAFEIPLKWSGTPNRIYWTAMSLKKFNGSSFKCPPGFRPKTSDFKTWPNVTQFFRENNPLLLNHCEDISPNTMTLRSGEENVDMKSKKIVIVGVGSLGSMLTKSISKLSPAKIKLIDSGRIEPGNLIRHEALTSQVEEFKADAMRMLIKPMFKSSEVVSLAIDIVSGLPKFIEAIADTDLILDCTGDAGSNYMLLSNSKFLTHKVAIAFIKPGPAFGVLILKNPGLNISPRACIDKLKEGIPADVWERYNSSDSTESQEVRTAPGCYSTTFSAPYYRIRLLADMFLASILGWLNGGASSSFILLFDQVVSESGLGVDIKRYEVKIND